MPTPSIIDRRWGATSDAGCGVVAFVEPPEQRVGGAAVLRTVVDSDVVVDVASELPELVLGDTARGMPPLRHGEHAGEIDGLGVGHDRCDRVTGREPAGQRVVAEKRVDQWINGLRRSAWKPCRAQRAVMWAASANASAAAWRPWRRASR